MRRYCCRRMLLTHVDIIEKLFVFFLLLLLVVVPIAVVLVLVLVLVLVIIIVLREISYCFFFA